MNKKIIVGVVAIVVIIVAVGFFVFNGFEEKTEEIEIPSEEVAIEDAEKMRIVTNEEPPTSYYSEEGEFVGTTVDIVKEIERYLGLDTEIEVMSWARAYETTKAGPNVVLFTAARTQERIDHGFHFVGPVITRKHVLWARKGSDFNINSIQDIKDQNLQIGAMRSDWREIYFIDLGFTIDDTTSHKLSLQKLLDGKVDLWVSSDIEAPRVTEEIGVDMGEIEIAYIFKEASSYIILSKDIPEETVEEWKKAYAEIQKTDFFENASKKWTNTLGSKVGYAKDTGFFIR